MNPPAEDSASSEADAAAHRLRALCFPVMADAMIRALYLARDTSLVQATVGAGTLVYWDRRLHDSTSPAAYKLNAMTFSDVMTLAGSLRTCWEPCVAYPRAVLRTNEPDGQPDPASLAVWIVRAVHEIAVRVSFRPETAQEYEEIGHALALLVALQVSDAAIRKVLAPASLPLGEGPAAGDAPPLGSRSPIWHPVQQANITLSAMHYRGITAWVCRWLAARGSGALHPIEAFKPMINTLQNIEAIPPVVRNGAVVISFIYTSQGTVTSVVVAQLREDTADGCWDLDFFRTDSDPFRITSDGRVIGGGPADVLPPELPPDSDPDKEDTPA